MTAISIATDLLTIRAYVCGPEQMMSKATQAVAELAKNHRFTLNITKALFNSGGQEILNATRYQGLRSSIIFMDESLIGRAEAIVFFKTIFDVNRVAFVIVGYDDSKELLLLKLLESPGQWPTIQTWCGIEYSPSTSRCLFLDNSEAALNKFLEETPRDVPSSCILL